MCAKSSKCHSNVMLIFFRVRSVIKWGNIDRLRALT